MGFCGHSAIFSSRVERRFGPVVARKTYTRVCNDIARSSVCPLVRIVEVGRPLSVCLSVGIDVQSSVGLLRLQRVCLLA